MLMSKTQVAQVPSGNGLLLTGLNLGRIYSIGCCLCRLLAGTPLALLPLPVLLSTVAHAFRQQRNGAQLHLQVGPAGSQVSTGVMLSDRDVAAHQHSTAANHL